MLHRSEKPRTTCFARLFRHLDVETKSGNEEAKSGNEETKSGNEETKFPPSLSSFPFLLPFPPSLSTLLAKGLWTTLFSLLKEETLLSLLRPKAKRRDVSSFLASLVERRDEGSVERRDEGSVSSFGLWPK